MDTNNLRLTCSFQSTNALLSAIAFTFLSSVPKAQTTDLDLQLVESRNYPQVTVFPKYAVLANEASAVEHILSILTTFGPDACRAVPRSEPGYSAVKVVRTGNSFFVDGAFQFTATAFADPFPSQCWGSYPLSIGRLSVGKYSVSVTPAGGVDPRSPARALVKIEFAVLTLDQAKKGVIEIPAESSVQSGVGLISGWSCIAEGVEISIDGGARQRVPSESPRGDVEPICSHSNAGFGLLFNYNTLSEGEHTIQLYTKTIPIGAARKFRVVKPKGEFALGLKSEIAVPNFPEPGKSTTLDWREGEQRFGIKSVQ